VLKDLIFLTEDKKLQREVENFLSEWYNESEYIHVKTSGSTGIPKQYQVKKDHMRISARKTLSAFSVPEGGTALLCLSTETIAGKMMVVRAAENQMTLYVGGVRSNALCDLPISTVDLMAIVPLQLTEGFHCQPSILKNCATVLLGGGSISREHIDALKEHESTVYHTYGMTETLSHIAFRRVGKVTEDAYTPLDGVKISAENGRLKIDYPELGIEGLQTNDLVEIAPNNQFHILGRADFIINSGGIKFNPEELESLISHAIQEPFFIGGLPDRKLGERVVIVIEGAKKDTHNSLLDRIKPLLPLHSCPKEIYYVPEFMRTESLKIRRKETMSLL
jgi:O-succinylbenzoic acid--CoA ligase